MYAPAEIKQGDIIFLTVKTNPVAHKLSGSMFDKTVNFYKDSNKNVYTALIGVDMDAEPDLYSLAISGENENGGKFKKVVNINVKSAGFSIQRLTLPKEKVELDEATLSRVKLEDEKLAKVGSSGRATGPHLHWGIRLNNARVNPAALLSGIAY